MVHSLPIAAAEAVFDKLCAAWRQRQTDHQATLHGHEAPEYGTVSRAPPPPTALAHFFDGRALPLGRLDLSGLEVDPDYLAQLIEGQQRSLVVLNLIGTKIF
jgi:hypothetical protein